MHDRLTGVPPSEAVLTSMASDIASGNPTAAAMTAMQNRAFYDVTLKNFAMPWTNRDQTVFAPLNDYVATVIGMVRDDVPFDRVLYDDILYVGKGGLGVPAYSPASNDHYAALEAQGIDLKDGLMQTTQSAANGLPAEATAGVMTTRAAAAGVLHRGHQPGDVPLHDDQPPVPRHGAGDGHDAAAGSHPPGRQSQPRRRQPRVPEQLHRLPQRHGPDGAGLRVLRLRRDRGQARVHGGHRAAEVLPQQGHVPARATRRPTTTGTTTGARGATRCSAGTTRCRARGRARSRSVASSRTPTRSPAARCRRSSATSASARRATRRTAPRSRRWSARSRRAATS